MLFIFSHGSGRITLNQTDEFSCKANLANASKKDTGVWTMILDNGGTKERELKEYRHNILVTSSSKYNSVDGIGLSLTTPYFIHQELFRPKDLMFICCRIKP